MTLFLIQIFTIAAVAAIFWNLWRVKALFPRGPEIRAHKAKHGKRAGPFWCMDTLDWVDQFEVEMWRNRGTAATYVWVILAAVVVLAHWARP